MDIIKYNKYVAKVKLLEQCLQLGGRSRHKKNKLYRIRNGQVVNDDTACHKIDRSARQNTIETLNAVHNHARGFWFTSEHINAKLKIDNPYKNINSVATSTSIHTGFVDALNFAKRFDIIKPYIIAPVYGNLNSHHVSDVQLCVTEKYEKKYDTFNDHPIVKIMYTTQRGLAEEIGIQAKKLFLIKTHVNPDNMTIHTLVAFKLYPYNPSIDLFNCCDFVDMRKQTIVESNKYKIQVLTLLSKNDLSFLIPNINSRSDTGSQYERKSISMLAYMPLNDVVKRINGPFKN
jgi:hypothetical protein